jgi:hypothetical protein
MPNAAAGIEVLPFEFLSGIAIATSSFGTERNYGACFLSRIRTKRYRAASEEICYEKALFQLSRVWLMPH